MPTARRHPPRRRNARSPVVVAAVSAALLALWTASVAPEPLPTPNPPGVVWLPPRLPELRAPALAPALAAASEPSDDADLPSDADFAAASSRAVRIVADGLDDPPSATSSQPTLTEVSGGRREKPGSCDPAG